MSKQIKQGKAPLSARFEEEITANEFSVSMFRVDKKLAKEIQDAGMSFRWINAAKFKGAGGFHKSGWRPYRRTDTAAQEYGFNPEGLLVRFDMMLAVKTNDEQTKWKKFLRHRADMMSGVQSQKAGELRESFASKGVKVIEGYDSNGEGDDE